jgi:hypothetical protein
MQKRWLLVCTRVYPKVSGQAAGARTANGTALCHSVQLYRYFVSQSSEFCRHNPLCCFLTSVYCCKRIFRYRLSPETFGYTLVHTFLEQDSNPRSQCSSGLRPATLNLYTTCQILNIKTHDGCNSKGHLLVHMSSTAFHSH